MCTEIAAYLRSGAVFVALRVPEIEGATADPIPRLYGQEPYFPVFDVRDATRWPRAAVARLPLEPAREWIDWAANSLPAAPGERWTVLKVSPDTEVACPSGLDLAWWDLTVFIPFDPGPVPGAWDERVLIGYFCVVGSTTPPFLPASAAPATTVVEAATAAEPRVTALGPFPIRLAANPPDPPYTIGGPQVAWAGPPQRLALHFEIGNWNPGTPTVTLAVRSRLRLPWRIYDGSEDAPYPASPIAAPITLPANGSRDIWLVVEVPAGIGGAECVTLTASSTAPDRSTWNTGIVWLGEWPHNGNPLRRRVPRQ
jgi:hypothetical protein